MMKIRFSLFMTVFLSFLLFFDPLPVLGEERLIVNSEVLNVRSGPAITCERIGQVRMGQQFEITEEKNGWYKISWENKAGWVIKDYVSLKAKTQELEITGSIVNIRSGPGTNFSKLTSLPCGTRIEAVDFKDDWYQIICPAGNGWVAGWLVKTIEKNHSTTPPETQVNLPQSLSSAPAGLGISWTWEKLLPECKS
jgi:N-acetylmuramoyl-L-alanine amidase